MTEDIKPEVIKRTQEMLGKYIKKPPLTDKLLRKPPFRFLHDIITSVMKETGFMEGVLSAVETKAENIKDKEGKIAFLQKVIAAVEAAVGNKLTVKPNKIVAGHEPTKTNEFLQALGKALEKDNGTQQPATVKNRTKDSKATKKVKEETANKKKVVNGSVKPSKPSKVVENGFEDAGSGVHDTKSKVRKSSSQKIKDNEKIEQNGEAHEKEKKSENKLEEKERKKTKSKRKKSVDEIFEHVKDNAPAAEVEIFKTNLESNGVHNDVKEEPTLQSNMLPPVLEEKTNDEPAEPQAVLISSLPETNADTSKSEKSPELKKIETTKPSPSNTVTNNFTKSEIPTNKDGAIVSRPRTSIRPTTSRPASARPAAPRIRDRGEVITKDDVIRPVIGKVNVIVESEANLDQDEENVVTLDNANDVEDLIDSVLPVGNSTISQDHGHLVEQILETQKKLEDKSPVPGQKTSADKVEIEWDSNRSRETTNREVDKLRNYIQTLTRSANPLGKLLDFVQEDVDTMQAELTKWKELNALYAVQLAQEQSLTEQSIEPLKIHLKELQQNIEQQLEQMSVTKANIIRNDQKLQQLLIGN